MSDDIAPASRASHPRDVTDFLIELSVALHRHAIYPHFLERPRLAAGTSARSRSCDGAPIASQVRVLKEAKSTT